MEVSSQPFIKFFALNLFKKKSSSHLKTFKDFKKIVTRISLLRHDSTVLQAFYFHHEGITNPSLLKRILNYAISHNVQQPRINVKCVIHQFPSFLFSSHTLTSFNISIDHPKIYPQKILFSISLNMQALTSFSLWFFTFFCGDDCRA